MTMPTPYRSSEYPMAAQQPPVEGQIVPATTSEVVIGPGGSPVRIVGYREYAGGLAPIYQEVEAVQRTPPRDLSPQPLIDPRAQVLAAGGVGVGVAGWGLGQVLTAMAGMGAAAVGALALLILAVRMPAPGRRGADAGGQQQAQAVRGDVYNITNHNTVHNSNRWGGRSTTNL
ncbi:hypothetical protein [Streptomyces sp. XC 2026]|uniref:hypothetical protein n=1 Tax=Streptomyces sp. XC 2026 TaxID=2782004 RepID=UPI0019053A65|nr:hypothetical protein [Streptomyces sp. XC 2026]QQN79733.1 hypothetical protein IPZ77_21645 [Streptomyces sp. XC 2026]QQN80659.1 hypothetical protein IPZ77_27010 [Streptomyces sp. XC 2026]